MLVERINKNCNSGMCNLMYHLLNHMRKDLRTIGMLLALDSSLYEHLNVHVKQAYKRTFQKRRTRMMITLCLKERGDKRALPCKKVITVKILRQKNRRIAQAELIWLYLVRHCIMTMMDETARAADERVQRNPAVSFALGILELLI